MVLKCHRTLVRERVVPLAGLLWLPALRESAGELREPGGMGSSTR
ncbi:hypothetical protein SAMN04487820_104262 [Actinopolyspora mzabensis]|uniref:Uncharacterized protein n=1 Tax=Actinopolyspora mzabensis TaxID=995066 RepID=A0A1G8Z687_ACTMZ|nr:hypothetical protein SAMN04487820_104262 [Actinopolyspora mzabensis]